MHAFHHIGNKDWCSWSWLVNASYRNTPIMHHTWLGIRCNNLQGWLIVVCMQTYQCSALQSFSWEAKGRFSRNPVPVWDHQQYVQDHFILIPLVFAFFAQETREGREGVYELVRQQKREYLVNLTRIKRKRVKSVRSIVALVLNLLQE